MSSIGSFIRIQFNLLNAKRYKQYIARYAIGIRRITDAIGEARGTDTNSLLPIYQETKTTKAIIVASAIVTSRIGRYSNSRVVINRDIYKARYLELELLQ